VSIVLGAALACVTRAFDRGFLIVKAYAQRNQRNPIEQTRTAVQKSDGRVEATEVEVAAKYPGRLATLDRERRRKPCDAFLLALTGGN
jgi:hypothetical protein